ncbi:hypothetical protein D3C72_2543950 [compost metagenome]
MFVVALAVDPVQGQLEHVVLCCLLGVLLPLVVDIQVHITERLTQVQGIEPIGNREVRII